MSVPGTRPKVATELVRITKLCESRSDGSVGPVREVAQVLAQRCELSRFHMIWIMDALFIRVE